MSAHGLEVFDKTLHSTNIWLNAIRERIGGDRGQAWLALSTVLQEVRDELTADLAAHLGAELPLLVRGAYYQNYRPVIQPRRDRDPNAWLARIDERLARAGMPDPAAAAAAVLATVSAHVPRGAVEKVRGDLPEPVRSLWTAADAGVAPPPEKGELGAYSAGGRRGDPARATDAVPPLEESLATTGPGIPDEAVGPDQMSVPDQLDLSEAEAASRMADKLAKEREQRRDTGRR